MKTTDLFLVSVPALAPVGKSADMNNVTWYLAGAIIAFFLIGYLIYSLIKPEKF